MIKICANVGVQVQFVKMSHLANLCGLHTTKWNIKTLVENLAAKAWTVETCSSNKSFFARQVFIETLSNFKFERCGIFLAGSFPAKMMGFVDNYSDVDLWILKNALTEDEHSFLLKYTLSSKFIGMNQVLNDSYSNDFRSIRFGMLNIILYAEKGIRNPYLSKCYDFVTSIKFGTRNMSWHHLTAWSFIQRDGLLYERYMFPLSATKLTLDTNVSEKCYPNKHINNQTVEGQAPPSLKQIAIRACESYLGGWTLMPPLDVVTNEPQNKRVKYVHVMFFDEKRIKRLRF